MGHFLACSALRDVDIHEVAGLFAEYARSYGVAVDRIDQINESTKDTEMALFFAGDNSWSTVLWPEYFNIHDIGTALYLSEKLECLVSTVHVYDGDYWTHVLVENGAVLDRFASLPEYFVSDEKSAAQLRERWRGRPQVLSSRLGVSVDQIQGYLVHAMQPAPERRGWWPFRRIKQNAAPTGKVFEEDEFSLDDFWVFVDFWRRLGIVYESSPDSAAVRIILSRNFEDKLPASEEEL